jgi:DNA topoisomerase IB
VWICADERGHLQATGRDAKGRKQYRYHARWRELRDADKFDHLAEFARALPRIRRQVRADIALAGLPRRKVLALHRAAPRAHVASASATSATPRRTIRSASPRCATAT